MNWNPYKRIAALERELAGINLSHNRLIERFDQMERSNKGRDAWVASLETRLQDLQRQIGTTTPVLTISRADVEKEAKARLKRAAYSRKYYAKKRADAAKFVAGGAA
jgi:light-regulated signal transduction histidine kinase (bacteriophytochrome)